MRLVETLITYYLRAINRSCPDQLTYYDISYRLGFLENLVRDRNATKKGNKPHLQPEEKLNMMISKREKNKQKINTETKLMAIVRYNPWQEMNSLQRQFNRMFDDVLTPASFAEFGNFSKVPAAELTEADAALILKLEVPGMQPADINIEATAKSISISGERKSEVESEAEGKTRTEFRYGSFQRVIPLPVKIKNTEVKAEYKDGILHLTLPKAEEEKNKVVKVNLLEKADA